jgi:hypothetical protein
MKQKVNHQSVILLVEECSKENVLIKNWLESNNFSTRETKNIYDALDEISDFTVDHCPDVFMLPVSSPVNDFATIEELVQIYSESGDIFVTTFSDADGVGVNRDAFSRQFSSAKTNIDVLPRAAVAPANNRL